MDAAEEEASRRKDAAEQLIKKSATAADEERRRKKEEEEAEYSEDEAAGRVLKEAIGYTNACGLAAAMQENASTRQQWSRTTEHRIEHLGVTVVPARPNIEVLPSGGWDKLFAQIDKLASLPGTKRLRQGLAMAFITPLWAWACPITAVPPPEAARAFLIAIAKTGGTMAAPGGAREDRGQRESMCTRNSRASSWR